MRVGITGFTILELCMQAWENAEVDHLWMSYLKNDMMALNLGLKAAL